MDEPRPRTFARWRREANAGPGYSQIPADGACLSAFLLIRDPADPGRVALGSPSPEVDWERIGSLGPARVARIGDQLMLPSCHLVEYEAPEAAAARIAVEQLERSDLEITGPLVVSEAYGRPGAAEQHWDLHFLFGTTWPAGVPLAARPWKQIGFLDPRTVPRDRYARSHDDIVRLAYFETPT
ncbi:MAG: hypothetical protein L3J80_03290 [Thermoplasmata archaeon]|nr:hypothetical protein [Thermoplasmata archaeon]